MSKSDTLAVRLPWPPSVNSIWRKRKGGMRLSDAAQAFYDEAVPTAQAAIPRSWPWNRPGPMQVSLDLWPPSRTAARDDWDVDNFSKATLDALTRAGVWADDKQVHLEALTRRPADPDGKGFVIVQVAALRTRPGWPTHSIDGRCPVCLGPLTAAAGLVVMPGTTESVFGAFRSCRAHGAFDRLPQDPKELEG